MTPMKNNYGVGLLKCSCIDAKYWGWYLGGKEHLIGTQSCIPTLSYLLAHKKSSSFDFWLAGSELVLFKFYNHWS